MKKLEDLIERAAPPEPSQENHEAPAVIKGKFKVEKANDDQMSALAAKRAKLVHYKQEIQADAQRKTSDIDAEIKAIDRAIKTLNDAVKDYLCPVCKGSGNVRQCDAAGQMEDVKCSACNGTGVKT